MTEGDLEGVAVLFGALKALCVTQAGADGARLAALFDTHVRGVIGALKTALDTMTDPFLRQAKILTVCACMYEVLVVSGIRARSALVLRSALHACHMWRGVCAMLC
jgi:hypothetical protein